MVTNRGGFVAIDVVLPPGMEYLLKGRKNLKIDVRIGDYLTDDFFQTFTNFEGFWEFIYFAPYTGEQLDDDPKLYETGDMDRYIELTTQFHSYSEMFGFAVGWALQKVWNEGNIDGSNPSIDI